MDCTCLTPSLNRCCCQHALQPAAQPECAESYSTFAHPSHAPPPPPNTHTHTHAQATSASERLRVLLLRHLTPKQANQLLLESSEAGGEGEDANAVWDTLMVKVRGGGQGAGGSERHECLGQTCSVCMGGCMGNKRSLAVRGQETQI